MLTTRPRGTNDILPGDSEKWHYIEQTVRDVCLKFGYQEIRLPIFEHTELFQRGVGETTDIVEKEMYTFFDQKKRSITLRPEGTASTVRAYLENKLYALPQPVKMYYLGPMFRYEKPQAGRYRQFHQFGIEAFGSQEPSLDAEVISLAMDFYQQLGLKGLTVHLNSVGCPKCRPKHREILQDYLAGDLSRFCPDCQGRYERNPLRILDCKEKICQEISFGAPTISDNLCGECAEHFQKVQEYLKNADINYKLDKKLVRGLDYYTKTAFEIIVEEIGAQGTICGGGRYDGLVESLGGDPIPGVGFALGMERIFPTLATQGINLNMEPALDVFFIPLGEEADKKVFEILTQIRLAGIRGDKDYLGRSLRAQMKAANRLHAKYAIIIGEDEIAKETVIVRFMETSEQKEISMKSILNFLKRELG